MLQNNFYPGCASYTKTCIRCGWPMYFRMTGRHNYYVLENPRCLLGGMHMDTLPIKNKNISSADKPFKFELPDSWLKQNLEE